MKTLALIAKRGKGEAAALAREIHQRFQDRTLLADPEFAQTLGWPAVSEAELVAKSELVVVLGGDGTLIRAARMFAGREVPILGVNLGSLGFLTEIPQRDLFRTLEEVFEGRFRVEPRMKLSCRLLRGSRVVLEDEVLNDVVINKGALARIADHQMFIGSEFVATYKSDGVIISTPTGSTAYSMSAGGPIAHPALEGMVISPICPHALTQRPIVVPSDREIAVVLGSEVADVYLTLDGQLGLALQAGDRLEVRRAPQSALLIANPDLAYFSVLREKLHWGER